MKLFRFSKGAGIAQVTVVYGDKTRVQYTNLGEAIERALSWDRLAKVERSLSKAFPFVECQFTS